MKIDENTRKQIVQRAIELLQEDVAQYSEWTRSYVFAHADVEIEWRSGVLLPTLFIGNTEIHLEFQEAQALALAFTKRRTDDAKASREERIARKAADLERTNERVKAAVAALLTPTTKKASNV